VFACCFGCLIYCNSVAYVVFIGLCCVCLLVGFVKVLFFGVLMACVLVILAGVFFMLVYVSYCVLLVWL